MVADSDIFSAYNMAAVIPNVTRISSRVIRILGCNPSPMTLQGTNTYVIGTGKRRVLIDTGDADVPQYINHLKTVLRNEKIDLSHVFITHWHHDHIGGLSDVMGLEKYTKYAQVWKFPNKENDDIPSNIKCEYLKDGQEFSVEGATLRVVHTPGHTADHVVFHLLEENAVLSGDCVLGEGTAVFEDLHDYTNSLKGILELQPEVIYPGHGNIVHDPQERIKFYLEHRTERENQILNVLQINSGRDLSVTEIVAAIYTDTPKRLLNAAAINVEHHLAKLQKEGRVTQTAEKWQYKEKNKL